MDLLIDDTREPGTCGIPIGNIVVTRNPIDGIEQLEISLWDTLYLDHDLGFFSSDGKEVTGMDILIFLENNPQHLPKDIQIVSSNAAVRAKMEKIVNKLYTGEWE